MGHEKTVLTLRVGVGHVSIDVSRSVMRLQTPVDHYWLTDNDYV